MLLLKANKIGRSVHTRFSAFPGSQHIASEFALRGLVRWLAYKKPHSVLEVGAGIGTITHTLIECLPLLHPDGNFRIVSLEDHEYCLEQLHLNLGESIRGVEIYPTIEAVPDRTYDFVIIDGGLLDERYFRNLADRAAVFVEGGRASQREVIHNTPGPWARANFKPLNRGKGYWAYQRKPTVFERALLGARQLPKSTYDLMKGRGRKN